MSTIRHCVSKRVVGRVSRLVMLVLLLIVGLLATTPVALADPGPGWRGEYYNSMDFSGPLVLVRDDAAIDFDWDNGFPGPGVDSDHFSARWTAFMYLGAGNYTFHTLSDDGVRFWVDGQIVIDQWHDHPEALYEEAKYLHAGYHSLRLEYYENVGHAVCKLWWDVEAGDGPGPGPWPGPGPGPWPGPGPGPWPDPDPWPGPGPGPGPIAQEIVVDDRDTNFVWGGLGSSWYGRDTGYRGHLYWTWNSNAKLYNWAKWFPYVNQAGNWEAYVYVASRYHGSKSARYQIHYAGGSAERVVNQNNYSNQWISLGTYYFNGGADEYVYLSDVTGETYGTRFVGFDAVKFVKRDGGVPPWPGPHPPGPYPPAPACAITPVLGFGNVWHSYSQVRSKLGCATEAEKTIWAMEQPLVGGYMFWRSDETYIYLLFNNGTWQGYDDTWMEGQPLRDPALMPPRGYYPPERGFGMIWRNDPAMRHSPGWAITQARGLYAAIQPFEHGLMIWTNTRGVYVLYNDGSWELYN